MVREFPTFKVEIDDWLASAVLITREAMRLAKRHEFDIFELPRAKVYLELTPTSAEGMAALEDFLDEAAEGLFIAMKVEKLEPVESTE